MENVVQPTEGLTPKTLGDVLPEKFHCDYSDKIKNLTVQVAYDIQVLGQSDDNFTEADTAEFQKLYSQYTAEDKPTEANAPYWNQTPAENEAYWNQHKADTDPYWRQEQ